MDITQPMITNGQLTGLKVQLFENLATAKAAYNHVAGDDSKVLIHNGKIVAGGHDTAG